jgi:hypothetical protein
MNPLIFKRVFPQVLACAVLIALCGGIALAQDSFAVPPPAAAVRTDGQIEMDVVRALDTSTELKNDLITAATIQGEVTLSGTVSSDASRRLAESLAGHVPGVAKVNNNLKVGNPQEPPPAQPAAGNQPGYQEAPESEGDQGSMQDQIRAEVQAQIQAQKAQQQSGGQGYSAPPSRNSSLRPAAPKYQEPTGPVTIPQGTLLQLRTSESIKSKKAKEGQPVQFMVIRDVSVGGVLAIPRGATVHGVVTEVKKSGELAGSPVLALRLTSLDLGGQNYPLDSGEFKVKGPNKAGHTVSNAFGGAVMGALIGGAADRGFGAAVGAGAGAAAGMASSAATPGPGIWIPAEARVDFHLNSPLTVNPVSLQEAARLAQGLFQGGPALYHRGYSLNGQPYRYGYGYPPVYYRPYYSVGGYYYWR